ncbi:MAG: hypothetical protein KKH94_00150 [Candidatus Omnitrophica bacterium]|nr:hypothetical protein [Candidatus Omnitrophota bacterium]
MKRKCRWCWVSVIILLLFSGCAPKKPAVFTEYFPATPGQEWIYDSMSQLFGAAPVNTKIAFHEGKTFGYYNEEGVYTLVVDTDGIKIVKRGEMERGLMELTFEPPILLLPSELVKNKRVELSGTIVAKNKDGKIIKGTYSGYVKILNINKTVSTRRRKFTDCLQIERSHYFNVKDIYIEKYVITEEYKAGVGLVREKSERYEEGNGEVILDDEVIQTLVTYDG